MIRLRNHMLWMAAVVALGACHSQDPPPAVARSAGQTIRVAVIGGMLETGFWQALAERYQAAHGNRIEVAAAGPGPRWSTRFAAAASTEHGTAGSLVSRSGS